MVGDSHAKGRMAPRHQTTYRARKTSVVGKEPERPSISNGRSHSLGQDGHPAI